MLNITGKAAGAGVWVKRATLLAMMLAVVGLTACGKKEKIAGQTLVKVDGEEITAYQVNEELQRAGVRGPQADAARKQVINSLVERQLVFGEAVKNKMDRDPSVVQAIENAKIGIVVQTFMQRRLAALPKPTQTEIEKYFNDNPTFFAQRKQFQMTQLVFASKDLTDEMKKAIDAAKSIDEVASYLDGRKVKFERGPLVRSTSDVPLEMSKKLLVATSTQLFWINEGGRSLLLAVNGIKDAPVTVAEAKQQIEKFLLQKKGQEAVANLLKDLRAKGKIEYANEADKVNPASASASAAASAALPGAAAPAASAAAASAAAASAAAASAAAASAAATSAPDAAAAVPVSAPASAGASADATKKSIDAAFK